MGCLWYSLIKTKEGYDTMKQVLSSESARNLLDSVGENIFVADENFNIIFINKYSEELLESISPYTGFKNRDDYLGKNMTFFHSEPLAERIRAALLQYTAWPYETTISLFDKFTASISITPYELSGDRRGYVLTWKDVTKYETVLREDHSRLEEMYTSILETSVDGCILVPIVGFLSTERLEKMKTVILDECERRKATTIIFDFSGFTNFTDPEVLAHMQNLKVAFALLGVEQILTGIRSRVAAEISQLPMTNLGLKIFPSFKEAISYVWKKNDLELVKRK
jgi:rsbT co-antagonist protein RsbR